MKRILFCALAIVGACGMIGETAHASGTLTATLTWENPLDHTDGIQVEKAAATNGPWHVLTQANAGTASIIDSTNGPGETACYRVAYFNTAGPGPYAGPVCKTFPVPPTPPTQAPLNLQVN